MLFKLAWRNIWRNRRRSLITIVSVMIAVFLAVFMRSMQLGMYAHMIDNVVGAYSGYIQIHKKGFWEEQSIENAMEIPSDLLPKIKSIPGVQNIIQRLQTFALASKSDISQGVLVNGVHFKDEQILVDWNTRLKKGKLFSEKDNEIVVAQGVAKIFELQLNDTLVLIGQGYHGSNAVGKYVVSGVVDMKNPKLNNLAVFMNITAAQEFVGANNLVSHLIIHKSQNSNEEILAKQIATTLDTSNYEIMTWRKMLPELEQTILADSVGGLIMVFILYLLISFGIFGTVLMMTQERTYEFGVLVAIGMKKSKLIATLALETIMLSLLGVVIGVLGILPLMYYFNANPIVLGEEEKETLETFGFEPIIPMSIDFGIPFTHGAIIFVIALVIALYPTWYINRLNPIESMKK